MGLPFLVPNIAWHIYGFFMAGLTLLRPGTGKHRGCAQMAAPWPDKRSPNRPIKSIKKGLLAGFRHFERNGPRRI